MSVGLVKSVEMDVKRRFRREAVRDFLLSQNISLERFTEFHSRFRYNNEWIDVFNKALRHGGGRWVTVYSKNILTADSLFDIISRFEREDYL